MRPQRSTPRLNFASNSVRRIGVSGHPGGDAVRPDHRSTSIRFGSTSVGPQLECGVNGGEGVAAARMVLDRRLGDAPGSPRPPIDAVPVRVGCDIAAPKPGRTLQDVGCPGEAVPGRQRPRPAPPPRRARHAAACSSRRIGTPAAARPPSWSPSPARARIPRCRVRAAQPPQLRRRSCRRCPWCARTCSARAESPRRSGPRSRSRRPSPAANCSPETSRCWPAASAAATVGEPGW